MGDDPNEFGNSPLDRARGREQPAPARNGLDRPLPDPPPELDTDIDETLGALTDLVRAGKVRYIGSSTFPASAIVEAQWVAERRGRERFVCEQPPYSLLHRGIEADVLPTCRRYGMGVILEPARRRLAVRALAQGRRRSDLAALGAGPGRYDLSVPENQRKLDAADALAQLADEAGMSLIEMALAFVIRHPAVTAAIIGPRTMEHLESQLTAADLERSPTSCSTRSTRSLRRASA